MSFVEIILKNIYTIDLRKWHIKLLKSSYAAETADSLSRNWIKRA